MGRKPKQVARQLSLTEEYKNKSEAELLDIANKITGKTDIQIETKFVAAEERKIARDLQNKYLHDYSIETIAERNTLQELIYLEVLQIRLQRKLNELYENENQALPLNIIDTIHKNSEAIIKLKSTLGLNKSKDKHSGSDAIELLKLRHRKWREDNQAGRSFKCPHCQKFTLLKMRTEAWEAQKHPYFKDNLVYNQHLFKNLDKTLTIDRGFISQVLEVSPDYIDWVISKVQQTPLEPKKESITNGSEEKREKGQEEVTEELLAKGKDVIKDFDEASAITVDLDVMEAEIKNESTN